MNKENIFSRVGIQSKKAKSIFLHCDVIHSIDRMKIVDIFSELENQYKISREYFIQINIGDEPQKGGVEIDSVENFYKKCIEDFKLNVVGLMCIPPFDKDSKPYFTKMRELSNNLNIRDISMGMYNDYMEAINQGSTFIRVGSKIFGARG